MAESLAEVLQLSHPPRQFLILFEQHVHHGLSGLIPPYLPHELLPRRRHSLPLPLHPISILEFLISCRMDLLGPIELGLRRSLLRIILLETVVPVLAPVGVSGE